MAKKLDNTVERINELKKEKAQIEAEIKSLTGELTDLAKKQEVKTLETGKYRVTVVTTERVSFDSDVIKHSLPKEKWKAISQRTVSKALIEKAIRTGLIQPTEVEDGVKITHSSPYIRVSEIKSEE